MKKFLRFNLPHSQKEVPLTLDAAVLAMASVHARSLRRKRLLTKLIYSGTAAAAAAVVITVSGVFTAVPIHHQENQIAPQIVATKALPVTPTVSQESSPVAITNSELLALADTSSLEQESFNLAAMAEFSFDSDNFTI